MHFALPRDARARELAQAPLLSNTAKLAALPADFLRRPIAALIRVVVARLARPWSILANAAKMRALSWSHWHPHPHPHWHRQAVPAKRPAPLPRHP